MHSNLLGEKEGGGKDRKKKKNEAKKGRTTGRGKQIPEAKQEGTQRTD